MERNGRLSTIKRSRRIFEVLLRKPPQLLLYNNAKISQADERFLKELTVIRSTKPGRLLTKALGNGNVLSTGGGAQAATGRSSVGCDGKLKVYDEGNSDVHLDDVRFTDDGRVEHATVPTDGDDSRNDQIAEKYAAKASSGHNSNQIGPKSVGGVVLDDGGHSHYTSGHKPWDPPPVYHSGDDDSSSDGNQHSTRTVGGNQNQEGECPYFVDLRPADVGCGGTLNCTKSYYDCCTM